MKLTKFAFAYFCLVIFSCSIFGQTSQKTASEIEDIVKVLEQSAKSLEYEALKTTHLLDKWEEEEKKALLHSHAYYTLLGKDFKGSCLLPDGEIDVTILIFKETQSAQQQIAQFIKEHPDFKARDEKSDNQGYYVEGIGGIYAATIKGVKVILFEDRNSNGAQAEIIKSLVDDLR
jgi:hypothetical protein